MRDWDEHQAIGDRVLPKWSETGPLVEIVVHGVEDMLHNSNEYFYWKVEERFAIVHDPAKDRHAFRQNGVAQLELKPQEISLSIWPTKAITTSRFVTAYNMLSAQILSDTSCRSTTHVRHALSLLFKATEDEPCEILRAER